MVPPRAVDSASVHTEQNRRPPKKTLYSYGITIGIKEDEFALTDFYIVHPIHDVFAFSIGWYSLTSF